MPDPAKNILIGLFVIAACFLIVGVLLFLHPTVGDCGRTLSVRFSDIDKITTGTRVSFAGRPVGEVLSVKQLDGNRSGHRDRFDRLYTYELQLCIDSSITVYNTDKIGTYTSGLLGERSISITPLRPKEGVVSRELLNGDTIYAEGAGSMDDALEKLGSLGSKAERALDLMGEFLEENKATFSETLVSAQKTFDEIRETVDAINEKDVIVSVKEAAGNFSLAMDSLNEQFLEVERRELWLKMSDILGNMADITDGLNDPQKWQEIVANLHSLTEGLNDLEGRVSDSWDSVDDSLNKFGLAMNNVSTASGDVRTIFSDIRGGKGALGKILNRDDFYLRLNTLLAKADTLMNDVNHYGLLFHRERGWQRERTKRMTQVHNLQTASEFQDHFNSEMDQIHTSLGRVHVLLEEADDRGTCDELLDNECFAKVFRELLLNVQSLQDSIELYNEDLVQTAPGEECTAR